MFKSIILILLILIPSLTYAQVFRLKYQPEGVIIHFHLQGSDFYTDTSALVKVYNEKNTGHKAYASSVKAHIRKVVKNAASDTISFLGEYIFFTEDIITKESDRWYLPYAIVELIEKRKVVIKDTSGHFVTKLRKAVKEQTENSITFSYTSHNCGEQILEKTYPTIRTITEIRVRRF